MRLRRAFTLPELLIVIGIIALLVALLFPAIGRARASARSAQCAANCRAVSQAMIAYAMQNDSYLPGACNRGQYWSPSLHLAYYFQAASSNPNYPDLDLSHGAIMPYLGDTTATRAAMTRCPDANPAEPNYSYVVNSQIGNEITLPGLTESPIYHLTQIKNPSEKIIVFEADWPNDGHFILGKNDDVPSIHHFRPGTSKTIGYGNHGFGDGHVESLPQADVWANPLRAQLTH